MVPFHMGKELATLSKRIFGNVRLLSHFHHRTTENQKKIVLVK
jgi:hypothetical protein